MGDVNRRHAWLPAKPHVLWVSDSIRGFLRKCGLHGNAKCGSFLKQAVLTSISGFHKLTKMYLIEERIVI